MKVLGIVGSYRKNGIVDSLVTEVLSSAKEQGAATKKIYLTDTHIEFCRNCRQCTQEAGPEPGTCVHSDEMNRILTECKDADGLVLGAPVNFFNVTAITRRFMERLVCFTYWPWGQAAPKMRSKKKDKKAVIITATAMPACLGRVLTGGMRALKITAEAMGAKPIKTIFAGLVAQDEHARPSNRTLRAAQAAGRRLARR